MRPVSTQRMTMLSETIEAERIFSDAYQLCQESEY